MARWDVYDKWMGQLSQTDGELWLEWVGHFMVYAPFPVSISFPFPAFPYAQLNWRCMPLVYTMVILGGKRHMGGLTYSPSFHCRFQNFKTMTNPPGIVSPILDLHWELGTRPVYMKWKYYLRFQYALRLWFLGCLVWLNEWTTGQS